MWLCTSWNVDWDAISSISTALATIVALFGMYYAMRADHRRQLSEQKQREHMTAVIAVAFDHELHMAQDLLKKLIIAVEESGDSREAMLNVLAATSRIQFPMLERFADKFNEFKHPAGAKLAVALSKLLQQRLNSPPDSDSISNMPIEFVDRLRDSSLAGGKDILSYVSDAREAISVDVARVARISYKSDEIAKVQAKNIK